MANYVFTFRGAKDRTLTAEDEARWGAWFGQIASHITNRGDRVGEARSVGGPDRPDVLSGYIVISADNMDAAVAVAQGCPALQQGGSLEVGELIPA